MEVFERIKWNDGLDSYRKTPNELRQLYATLDADVVYAFQLRYHSYITYANVSHIADLTI